MASPAKISIDKSTTQADAAWVFGYGSLIWRPDIPYVDKARAVINGFSRRFWQGSHDHRGVPEQPGRVVTLTPSQDTCVGMAYLVPMEAVQATFEKLDYREKNGYARHQQILTLCRDDDTHAVEGLVYIATADNFAYLGEAEPDVIARQILRSHGPSGSNLDYLLQLADALRALDADDPHVFELEYRVRHLMGEG
ncbi:MAG: gamma-glutamylcyclotransferase [Pseudomonadota bacterium]